MEIVIARNAPSNPETITPDLLMRGMAHDLNNMLAVVSSGLSALERADPAKRARLLAGMHRAIANAATLAKDIISLTADHRRAPETISLASVIDGMGALLEGTLGERVSFESSVPDDLWPIRVVRAYLEFALLNLIVNAVDAMPAGGTLSLSARNVLRRRPAPSGGAGEFVRIDVADTGEGMPEQIVSRAFDPFFTTKAASRGTGLGLGQVRRFIEQHGGDVTIESSPGSGTRVTLHLPRAASLRR